MRLRFAIEYTLMPNGVRAYVPIGIWAYNLESDIPDAEARFLPGYEDRADHANDVINEVVEAGKIPEGWLEHQAETIGDYTGAFGAITDVDKYGSVVELLDRFIELIGKIR